MDQARVSPVYVEARLRLGWRLFHLAVAVMAASQGKAERPEYPEIEQAFSEIREILGVHISPPSSSMSPREFIDWLAQRIELSDPAAGNIFRLGASIYAWWNFKGHHDDTIDAMLWQTVSDDLGELEYQMPGASERVSAVLRPLMPAQPQDTDGPQMLRQVSIAVAGDT